VIVNPNGEMKGNIRYIYIYIRLPIIVFFQVFFLYSFPSVHIYICESLTLRWIQVLFITWYTEPDIRGSSLPTDFFLCTSSWAVDRFFASSLRSFFYRFFLLPVLISPHDLVAAALSCSSRGGRPSYIGLPHRSSSSFSLLQLGHRVMTSCCPWEAPTCRWQWPTTSPETCRRCLVAETCRLFGRHRSCRDWIEDHQRLDLFSELPSSTVFIWLGSAQWLQSLARLSSARIKSRSARLRFPSPRLLPLLCGS
jgi:hypothetical protein